MAAHGSFRSVVACLLDRSPEILFIGGGANALVTFVLYMFPTWRSGLVFVTWGAVYVFFVFVANFRTQAEIAKGGVEPKPWRTLVAMQILYVVVAWVVLSRP